MFEYIKFLNIKVKKYIIILLLLLLFYIHYMNAYL